jgi:transcriptional regulator with XRE-family HTH domain
MESTSRLLGDFLRAHRERLTPEAAGLPGGGRRRTPGLRREEAAALAGLSPTWLSWLEQGREVGASPEALGRLARALHLTAAERGYLFELAGRRDPQAPAAPDAPAEELALVVDAISAPAYLLDRYWDAAAWNAPARALFDGWLGGAERNLVRYVLIDPDARRLIPDWEERAMRLLAEFRADFGRGRADPRMQALVDGLERDSAEFRRLWGAQAVTFREGGPRRLNHPELGVRLYRQVSLSPAARPDHKLVVLLEG